MSRLQLARICRAVSPSDHHSRRRLSCIVGLLAAAGICLTASAFDPEPNVARVTAEAGCVDLSGTYSNTPVDSWDLRCSADLKGCLPRLDDFTKEVVRQTSKLPNAVGRDIAPKGTLIVHQDGDRSLELTVVQGTLRISWRPAMLCLPSGVRASFCYRKQNGFDACKTVSLSRVVDGSLLLEDSGYFHTAQEFPAVPISYPDPCQSLHDSGFYMPYRPPVSGPGLLPPPWRWPGWQIFPRIGDAESIAAPNPTDLCPDGPPAAQVAQLKIDSHWNVWPQIIGVDTVEIADQYLHAAGEWWPLEVAVTPEAHWIELATSKMFVTSGGNHYGFELNFEAGHTYRISSVPKDCYGGANSGTTIQWRDVSFDDVIGDQHITKTVRAFCIEKDYVGTSVEPRMEPRYTCTADAECGSDGSKEGTSKIPCTKYPDSGFGFCGLVAPE
jgi:hypothetical protein